MGFRRCSSCDTTWPSANAFLSDPRVTMVGYQLFELGDLDGLFLFNHERCGTTLGITGSELSEIVGAPSLRDRPRKARPAPPAGCLNHELGKGCAASCECSWVARALATIRGWPKAPECDTPVP
jgi:hypothetical protein